MRRLIVVILFLTCKSISIAEPGGCAGPAMDGTFILMDDPIQYMQKGKEKIGVIYRFKIDNSAHSFDLFIDLNKFGNVKFIKGRKYNISMVHNCKDNSLGYKLLYGQDYDHTNIVMYISSCKAKTTRKIK